MMLDLEVYELVHTKAVAYTYRKTCDINYSYVFSHMNESDIEEFIKNIAYLNEWSYNKRYEHHEDVSQEIALYKMLKLEFKGKAIDSVQMLKYLECIHYQIEMHTIKTGYDGMQTNLVPQHLVESYELLEKAIEDIKSAIVKEFSDYEDKKWCNA